MTSDLKILIIILLSTSFFLSKKSGGMAPLDSNHVYR